MDKNEKSLQERLSAMRGMKVYKEKLKDIEGIELLGFEDVRGTMMNPKIISENTDENKVLEWVIETLMKENIQGECFLRYSSKRKEAGRFVHWARVKLSNTYTWVEPLWEEDKGLYILSLDLTYKLAITEEEYDEKAIVYTRDDSDNNINKSSDYEAEKKKGN